MGKSGENEGVERRWRWYAAGEGCQKSGKERGSGKRIEMAGWVVCYGCEKIGGARGREDWRTWRW